jgi:hypothetical protein
MSKAIDARPAAIVLCETATCSSSIAISVNITDEQGAAIAEILGWTAKRGSHRYYHRCPRCAE